MFWRFPEGRIFKEEIICCGELVSALGFDIGFGEGTHAPKNALPLIIEPISLFSLLILHPCSREHPGLAVIDTFKGPLAYFRHGFLIKVLAKTSPFDNPPLEKHGWLLIRFLETTQSCSNISILAIILSFGPLSNPATLILYLKNISVFVGKDLEVSRIYLHSYTNTLFNFLLPCKFFSQKQLKLNSFF